MKYRTTRIEGDIQNDGCAEGKGRRPAIGPERRHGVRVVNEHDTDTSAECSRDEEQPRFPDYYGFDP